MKTLCKVIPYLFGLGVFGASWGQDPSGGPVEDTLLRSGVRDYPVVSVPGDAMVLPYIPGPDYNNPLHRNEQYTENLRQWQAKFSGDNNLREIPVNRTLADGSIMDFAAGMNNPAGLEFYRTEMLMNRTAAGDTQLERMNVRMRSIRYVDFIGAGRLGVTQFTAPQKVGYMRTEFRIGKGGRK